MKYGDTLRQRSIPEWGHFNIDYDFLKDQIKLQTTPGSAKAMSIPGQGETTEKAFGQRFFYQLQAQHDRINLFMKSKSGEIERRLQHINKQLVQLQARWRPQGSNTQLPARLVERYAKIDADVTKAGEEIRSLSRFRSAQRTGFNKILKKYKRWTKDSELEHRFKEEIAGSTDSFFRLDLGYLLDQYIDVLNAVRAPFNASRVTTPSLETGDPLKQSHATCLNEATEARAEVDFDTALSVVPLGSRGSKATYWIHADNVVETEVLLLQYMRLHHSSKATSTPRTTPHATPARRKSSATVYNHVSLGNEDDTGRIIIDDPDGFARKHNASTVGSREEATGVLRARAVGNVRWTSSGEATVVVGMESNQDERDSESMRTAKLKRKHLTALFNIKEPFDDQIVVSDEDGTPDHEALDKMKNVRDWLEQHPEARPIAGISTKRTRFAGLHNGSSMGLWATLDRDVVMTKSLLSVTQSNDWVTEARTNAQRFPHAVLEIRREGNQSAELIQLLDHSHLVERVRGFSIEAHAVWICCKPDTMVEPLWLSLLQRDIRKLPTLVKRQPRRAMSSTGSSSNTPPHTSNSMTSITDGQTSPSSARDVESLTSASELQPTLRSFRKKPRSGLHIAIPIEESPAAPRYWNEYDNPESEEDGYYIYVDPNATVKFPGQELLENFVRSTKKLLGFDRSSEDRGLRSAGSASITSDEDDTASESTRNYGTVALPSSSAPSTQRSYFSSLFGTIRDPSRDALLHRERHSLLHEIHVGQHEREMTKLRLYTTCLISAVIIDVLLGVMAMTSRRKERGVADGAVLFGTIASLLLLVIAVPSMRTRRERLGWMHQGAVLGVAVAVVTMDVLLLHWVLRP